MIKFVYFDVGGVVITDFSGTNKWRELKQDLIIGSDRSQEFDEFFTKYETEVCVGRDIETIVPLMKKQFDLKLPSDYLFLNDFVDRFERNESIWPIIERATSKYKIGLLTNMYPRMFDLICKKGLMSPIKWDVIIDSSVEKCMKPETKIFALAQRLAGVKNEEILFVENSARHIKAAEKFGWQTFLYDSSNVIKSSRELNILI